MDPNMVVAAELVRRHHKEMFEYPDERPRPRANRRHWWHRERPARRKVSYPAGTLVACAPAVVE